MSKTRLEEEIIVGAWLRGDRLDTLQYFEREDFGIFGLLFMALNKRYEKDININIIEISKECGISLEDLARLMTVSEIDFAGCGRIIKAERIRKITTLGEVFSEEYYRVVNMQTQLEEKLKQAVLVKRNLLAEYLEELDRRSERKAISMGIESLDTMLGGLRQGELTTIAARPAVGKSAFCLQVAERASQDGKRVLFFALEMTPNEMFDRLTQRWSDIHGSKLRKGSKYFNDTDSRDIALLLDTKLGKFNDNVWIETNIANIDLFKAVIENEKPNLVIVDQLSCLRTTKNMTIRERYCYCTTLLKRISVECNIPILLAAQIGRSGDGRVPTMTDLKESGSIEEDSDNVILMSLIADDEEQQVERRVFCELAKHRQGATGSARLMFVSNKVRFYEVTR